MKCFLPRLSLLAEEKLNSYPFSFPHLAIYNCKIFHFCWVSCLTLKGLAFRAL